jgi:hypothetical protein
MSKVLSSLMIAFSLAAVSSASLLESYQFNGKGNWSIDGVGSNNTPVGVLQALVPEGSRIEKAFLYSSLVWSAPSTPTVSFDGNVITGGDFVALGSAGGLQAYRADVTSIVTAKVGSGSADMFDFTVNSEDPNYSIDGEVLAIVFSNPNESERTIAFLDGFSNQDGDVATFDFSEPMPDPSTPGFEALMSLGIGYSYQQYPNGQYSKVYVNDRQLSSSSGGEDDGTSENGGLLTVGGLGDDPSNPADPNATNPANPYYDDELYNLALGNGVNPEPFLAEGTQRFTIRTLNPSHDDNIFFWGVNVTAKGSVYDDDDDIPDDPPSNNVPEPASLSLFGIGLISLALIRKKRN